MVALDVAVSVAVAVDFVLFYERWCRLAKRIFLETRAILRLRTLPHVAWKGTLVLYLDRAFLECVSDWEIFGSHSRE